MSNKNQPIRIEVYLLKNFNQFRSDSIETKICFMELFFSFDIKVIHFYHERGFFHIWYQPSQPSLSSKAIFFNEVSTKLLNHFQIKTNLFMKMPNQSQLFKKKFHRFDSEEM